MVLMFSFRGTISRGDENLVYLQYTYGYNDRRVLLQIYTLDLYTLYIVYQSE